MKILKLFLSLAIISFSFMAGNFNNSRVPPDLLNIEVLQASAVEAGCDDRTINSCTVATGGFTLYGLGQPYINY